ncbi:MAG: TlpA family protein disulfide reductase [Chloroflexi bacterium]|nr:TlpA family protein disulfide reductase [Chloroflexota bacterium]
MAKRNQPRSKRARKAGFTVLGLALLLTLGCQGAIPSPPPTSAPDLSVAIPIEGTEVGQAAPAFQVTDAFDREVTLSSLIDQKPGLLFFTTTYCLPCIEGLQHLARFQADLGGDHFSVLIVFVDLAESDRDLQNYQQYFGFPPDWYYALDTDDMVVKYRIRALDTKFVIDLNGVIQYADVFPANYETWRQALATVGIVPAR